MTSKMSAQWAFIVHERRVGKKVAETEMRVLFFFTNSQIPMIIKLYTVRARRSLKDHLAKLSGFDVEETET